MDRKRWKKYLEFATKAIVPHFHLPVICQVLKEISMNHWSEYSPPLCVFGFLSIPISLKNCYRSSNSSFEVDLNFLFAWLHRKKIIHNNSLMGQIKLFPSRVSMQERKHPSETFISKALSMRWAMSTQKVFSQ